MISEEKKREYYALAKQIKEGIHTPQRVLEAFERHPDEASEIVNFWLVNDAFTQGVVHYLAIEKLRIQFEKCYRKDINKWTLTKRKLMLIVNGLKQSLFGEREC